MMTNAKITEKLYGCEAAKRAGSVTISTIMWCTVCAKLVRMVTPEVAATFTRIDSERLRHCLEHRHLHAVRTQTGTLLICLESLADQA